MNTIRTDCAIGFAILANADNNIKNAAYTIGSNNMTIDVQSQVTWTFTATGWSGGPHINDSGQTKVT